MARRRHGRIAWTFAGLLLAFSLVASVVGATGPLPRDGFVAQDGSDEYTARCPAKPHARARDDAGGDADAANHPDRRDAFQFRRGLNRSLEQRRVHRSRGVTPMPRIARTYARRRRRVVQLAQIRS